MSAPETLESLAHHLRRMADNAAEQIDTDRLSRAANLCTPTDERVKALEAENARLLKALYRVSEGYAKSISNCQHVGWVTIIQAQSALRDMEGGK